MVEHSNDHKLRHTWLLKHKFGLMGNSFVVYFDQRTHACACVRMVENDKKHKKMMKKVPFGSCTREAREEKGRKKFVGQRLRVTPKIWLTPKSWLLIWNFEVFCYFFVHMRLCA